MATRSNSPRPSIASATRRAPTGPEIKTHETWAPGLHVAPFKHGWGGLCLVALDSQRRLAGMFDIEAGSGTYESALHSGRNNGDYLPEIRFDDTDIFSDFGAMATLGFSTWEPGIHRCPWLPRTFANGVALLIVAPNGVRWTYLEAPELTPDVVANVEALWKGADSDGADRLPYDYDEHEAIKRGERGRLLRIESQYQQDRAEYGRLIGLAAHEDGDEPTE